MIRICKLLASSVHLEAPTERKIKFKKVESGIIYFLFLAVDVKTMRIVEACFEIYQTVLLMFLHIDVFL